MTLSPPGAGPAGLGRGYRLFPQAITPPGGFGRGRGSNGFARGMNGYGSGRGWGGNFDNKGRGRGRGSYQETSNQYYDVANEQNRGPRTNRLRGQRMPGLPAGGRERPNIPGEDYNNPAFPVEYDAAKFYVIKSYSEDDVHKSIKYNVWASTPNGNRKLDAGYKEARAKAPTTSDSKCPVFFFFSVSRLLFASSDDGFD